MRPDAAVLDPPDAQPAIKATNIFCIFGSRTLSGILYYDEAARQIHAFAPCSDDVGAADQYFMIGGKS